MMVVTSKACAVAFRLALLTPYQRLGAAPRLTSHQRLGAASLRACASSPTPAEDAVLPPPSLVNEFNSLARRAHSYASKQTMREFACRL